ncbi:MAG: hypothetical protein IPH37_19170 [Burkholderiales bacterium]|nr:hypothetical protein [Burkholderiales bacterium]
MTATRSKPAHGTPLGYCILAGDISGVMDAVDATSSGRTHRGAGGTECAR